ncbi:MAG: metallophosphoesterase family protein [Gammaproteobacteria bacterium]|nr:metallophosphoesterase family protein [Gammaproteobacteria bacterium]
MNNTSPQNSKYHLVVLFCLVVLVSACGNSNSTCSDASPKTARGPYLQNISSTSIVIKWRSEQQTISRVRYGSSPNALVAVQEDQSIDVDHEVGLGNLVPDTRYYYAVNDTAETVFSFRTPPVEGTARPSRVWIVGDSGTADKNAKNVRDAFVDFNGSNATDLLLMLGDNAYDSGADCEYQRAFFDMYPATIAATPVMPTIGNHDAREDGGAPYFNIFNLPIDGNTGGVPSGTEAYYSFNYANIHFVSLDSETSNRSPSGAMYSWLMADLAANTQDWTVVYFHHPPYSKGTHDSDQPGTAMADMREYYTPVFEMYGVDLVFSGHSHNYERSFPILGHRGTSATFLESMKTDTGNGRKDGDGEYTKPYNSVNQGIVYTVAGSSGKTRSAPLNHPVHYLSMSKLGSVVLDFDGDQLNVTFVSPDPAAIDYYSIVKTI